MKLFSPSLCNSLPHRSLHQHVGDCQIPLALLPWPWQSRDMVRCALKAGSALLSRVGEKVSTGIFCLHWSLIKGEEDQQEVPTELFSSPTFVSRETREGQELVQLQSLAVAQVVFERRSVSAAICIPFFLPFQEEKLGRGENGHRR